jgi:alginate O-acetyltransferase complex protein AlgI
LELTDLRFAGFLLPLAAVFLAIVPRRLKAGGLLLLSCAAVGLMQPTALPLLLGSLAFDVVCAFAGTQWKDSPFYTFIYQAALAKSILLVTLYVIVLPFRNQTAPALGLAVVCLFSVCTLLEQRRGRLQIESSVAFASGALFFGALHLGPISPPARILSQLASVKFGFSRAAIGLMRFVLGLFKRVVLAEQLMALFKTLSRLEQGGITLASSWLTALCGGMALYFTLSSYGDIAVGLGGIFGLELPNLTYFPFQAKNPREYIYRLNMPLEEALGRLFTPNFDRESDSFVALFVSVLTPIVLGLMLRPSFDFLFWSLWLSMMAIVGWTMHFIGRGFPTAGKRVLTFFVCLPSYIFLMPVPFMKKLELLSAMVGLNVTLWNDTIAYLALSNLVLLLISLVMCTSIVETLGRLTFRQFPRLWWAAAPVGYLALLIVTSSFLLWNAR